MDTEVKRLLQRASRLSRLIQAQPDRIAERRRVYAQLRAAGVPVAAIAKAAGVSHGAVSQQTAKSLDQPALGD